MTIRSHMRERATAIAVATFGMTCLTATASAQRIQHDSERYVPLHQYADQWAAEDKEIDQKLAEIRQRNGDKPPNIVYILVDDMGFGEFGMPEH